MRLVQEFLPAMAKRNHGHIVTMASASSFISTTQLVTYASTKAAIMAFHEGVAQELRMRYNARRVRTT
jgi:short-subunit dehydrogenase